MLSKMSLSREPSKTAPEATGQLHLSETEAGRGHRRRRSRSASKARMTESDGEELDSILSVLETTLGRSCTDTEPPGQLYRSASAARHPGGYFVDEHGGLRRAASSGCSRSGSASRAGRHDTADCLRLSTGPGGGPKRPQPGTLVPAVALKAPTQPPRFTNFLRAHHAVPFDMHGSRPALSGPRGARQGPVATGGLASPADLSQLMLRSDPRAKHAVAQRQVLSVSAEHAQTGRPGGAQVRAVKPVSLAHLHHRPVGSADSTLRSASASLHEQRSPSVDGGTAPPSAGRLVFKGLGPLRPASGAAPRLLVQQAEFSEHSAPPSETGSVDGLSEQSFVDADVIRVPGPPSRKAQSGPTDSAADTDVGQSGVLLLNPRRSPIPGPCAESGSARFQTLGAGDPFGPLRGEFVALGTRLAQLANRRSYVESAMASYEQFASDRAADHTYLEAETGEAQQKLDAIEDELAQVLARRADLRQRFADAGVAIQAEETDARQLRRAQIDQALLLELGPLEAPGERSLCGWPVGDEGPSVAAPCGRGGSLCDDSVCPRPASGMSARSDSADVGLQVVAPVCGPRVSVEDVAERISQVIGPPCEPEMPGAALLMAALLAAFEDLGDAAAYSQESLVAYRRAVEGLGHPERAESVEAMLPIPARPYAAAVSALLGGLASLLRTGRATALARALVASRRSPGWAQPHVLRLLAAVLEILALRGTEGLDLHARTARSGGAWAASELLGLARTAGGLATEDVHGVLRSVLTFSPHVSPGVSNRWHREVRTIVSAYPQLQRYEDLQRALGCANERAQTRLVG